MIRNKEFLRQNLFSGATSWGMRSCLSDSTNGGHAESTTSSSSSSSASHLSSHYDDVSHPTTCEFIRCSSLPKHWRANKTLKHPFRVYFNCHVKENWEVELHAGNESIPSAEMRRNKAPVHNNEAVFEELRFVGRSGRGKSFDLTISVLNSEGVPAFFGVYKRAIKVTADGPRGPRLKAASAGRPIPLVKPNVVKPHHATKVGKEERQACPPPFSNRPVDDPYAYRMMLEAQDFYLPLSKTDLYPDVYYNNQYPAPAHFNPFCPPLLMDSGAFSRESMLKFSNLVAFHRFVDPRGDSGSGSQ